MLLDAARHMLAFGGIVLDRTDEVAAAVVAPPPPPSEPAPQPVERQMPAPAPGETDDVALYTSPWVSGTRACAYFGPIASELFLLDDDVDDRFARWCAAERELLESLRDKARLLRANAVVGLEITLDPYWEQPKTGAKGLRLHAVGTAAVLEALF